MVGEGTIRGERVVLAQPQTFMNLSGESVVQLLNWYKPEADHLLVAYDDVDLPEGRMRFRPSPAARARTTACATSSICSDAGRLPARAGGHRPAGRRVGT